jgi:hypothetical protein
MSISPLDVNITLRTNNGYDNSFSAWNPDALGQLSLTMGALDPSKWSYHVRGDLYLVPNLARKGHECGGSVNTSSVIHKSGITIEFSHVFYIDTTGHRHRKKSPHWNHELYIKIGNGQWQLFDKSKTRCHKIPISDWIEKEAKDANGKIETVKVLKT